MRGPVSILDLIHEDTRLQILREFGGPEGLKAKVSSILAKYQRVQELRKRKEQP